MGQIKTLALFNGDLMLARGGYYLFTGADRIRQDLTLGLTEEYGTDRFHPGYGSVVMRFIGNPISAALEGLVRAEVNRVLQNYIAIQQAEVLRDTQVDVVNRYTTSDVVRAVRSVLSSINVDRIDIQVSLETLSRTTVTIRKQIVST